MRTLLLICAAAEAMTGLVLLAYPPIMVRLLFGTEISGVGIVLSRFAGIALVSLGIACWPARGSAIALTTFVGMLVYNLLVTIYFAVRGISDEFVGVMLWPVVALHALLAGLLVRAWIKKGGLQSAAGVVLLLVFLVFSGCSSKPTLMPTPNLYANSQSNPFADVPTALQANRTQILYVTDRAPQKDDNGQEPSPDKMKYGLERSRSAAFGLADFQIGDENLTWDQLVRDSRSAKREKEIEVSVNSVHELGRFAPTPPSLIYFAKPTTQEAEDYAHTETVARQRFLDELNKQLAKTPRKDVYLFIHGFNVSFEGSIQAIGELWHFLGREGVPMAYSWPAGEGTIRAYEYTNQSVMFTIFHLKQTLRLIASCPAVEKIHILAHSRGTAVTTDAVRELTLEIRGKGDLKKELKLGNVVLAAADMDFDVVIERNVTARTGESVDATAIYVFKGDEALAFSNWLAGGAMRLGDVSTKIFSKQEIDAVRHSPRLQLIDARITNAGSYGHNYFHANPAVSSDLILFLRYNLPPFGTEARPLGVSESGFWIIDDAYPASASARDSHPTQGTR